MDVLEKDFKYFTDNHDDLFGRYPDKYLVIKDESVLFSADSFEDALSFTEKNGLEIGTFLIQYCTEGDSAYTQTFHSRAIF